MRGDKVEIKVPIIFPLSFLIGLLGIFITLAILSLDKIGILSNSLSQHNKPQFFPLHLRNTLNSIMVNWYQSYLFAPEFLEKNPEVQIKKANDNFVQEMLANLNKNEQDFFESKLKEDLCSLAQLNYQNSSATQYSYSDCVQIPILQEGYLKSLYSLSDLFFLIAQNKTGEFTPFSLANQYTTMIKMIFYLDVALSNYTDILVKNASALNEDIISNVTSLIVSFVVAIPIVVFLCAIVISRPLYERLKYSIKYLSLVPYNMLNKSHIVMKFLSNLNRKQLAA